MKVNRYPKPQIPFSIAYWLLGILVFCFSFSQAQNKKIDSLSHALTAEKEDTNKVKTLNSLSDILWGTGKYDSALTCAYGASELAQKIGFKKGLTQAYDNIGIIYGQLGDYPKALESFFNALKVEKETGNKNGIARSTGNIGIVYRLQGDYPKALEYFLDALKIYQELGTKKGIAINTGNVGVIYEVQGDYTKALEYYLKALKMMEGIGNKSGIANNTGNIGNVYDDQANQVYSQHEIAKSDSLYNKALEYHFKASKMYRELGDKNGMARNAYGVGEIFIKQKKYKQAEIELDSALTLSRSIKEKEDIRNAYKGMAELDSATGDYKKEVENYKKYIMYRDSLVNETNTKKSVQTAMNFTFEQKQAIEKAEQDKKSAVIEEEKNKQLVIRNSFIAGFLFMLTLAFFIFRGYNQKNKAHRIIIKQKEEVEEQKKLVEQKNKDILDSITYSKQLQDAILPPLSLIKKYLPESFVLYKPKDIVAGDFYWMETTGDNILIAAADCTGHGVPGALVSVVCSNALNRAVKEFKITEPGKILDKVGELVQETFSHKDPLAEKSGNEVRDGMDISLCCINTRTKEIKWSGANNPLWYIQNNEMKEIGSDKQPIGAYDNPKLFTTHTFNFQKGDILYLFTDGYPDQFGGEKGKKFKYKPLQEKLLSMASISMDKQNEILEETLESWKGSLDQVDDILVIGVRM